jgi:hypothetical protein
MKTSQSYIARIEGGSVRPSTDTCGFPDHDQQVEAFRGRIVVE